MHLPFGHRVIVLFHFAVQPQGHMKFIETHVGVGVLVVVGRGVVVVEHGVVVGHGVVVEGAVFVGQGVVVARGVLVGAGVVVGGGVDVEQGVVVGNGVVVTQTQHNSLVHCPNGHGVIMLFHLGAQPSPTGHWNWVEPHVGIGVVVGGGVVVLQGVVVGAGVVVTQAQQSATLHKPLQVILL